jgi:HK97 family phage major capsid protein
MPETKRVATQVRELTFDLSARVDGSDSIPVVLSTDGVVDVHDGPEILVHTPEAVDMRRAPLPIIAAHRSNQVNVGIVDNLKIAGGQLRGEARFGTRDEAAGYKRDVMSGVIRSVSVGYARMRGKVRADGVLVTDRWMPTHAAMVGEPADINTGFFRSLAIAPEFEIEVETAVEAPAQVTRAVPPAAAEPIGAAIMTDVVTPAAVTEPQNISAVDAEKERREAIINLCRSNKIDARVQGRWIEDGTPLTKVAKEVLDVMEERGKASPVAASEVGLSRKDTQRYSVFRAIRALHYGAKNPEHVRAAAFELECSAQIAKQLGRGDVSGVLVPGEVLQRPLGEAAAARAMATQPGSKGGYMVGVEVMGFIDILRNRSVAMRMGARQLSGLTGNVIFPRQTGKPTVTWQGGEGTSVTAADQTLGQLSMTPKTCIAITDVSEQLLRQATPSAEAFIMADLAADVAIDGVDNAAINGTGGSQPLGIKNTTGITSGQDSASATYAKILAFVSTAGALNAIRGNPGWITSTAGAARLMQVQRFTSTDTPLWTGNMLDGTCVGFNAMSSEQLASGNLIFGSFDELVIGDWGVLELTTDNGGTRFNQAQIGVRALWMVDVLLRYPQAFVVSTNLS